MFVIKNLSFHYFVVVVCAELASGGFLHLVVEAFADDDDVGVFAYGAGVGVDVGDTVWLECELAFSPTVRVERY